MSENTQQNDANGGTPLAEPTGSRTLCEMPDFEYDDEEEDLTCPHCGGSGSEPLDDGCMPCEYCDGEGYQYWL